MLALPHTGAVVTRDQPDRLSRLTGRLLAEIARRQQLLAEQGYADVAEQRAGVEAASRLPYLLVLLDRWEGFVSAFDTFDAGRLVDQWLQIMQEGAGVGVCVALTVDRSGLVGRLSTLVDDKLVLRMTDPGDFSSIGLPAKQVPEHMPPGRAFRSEGLQETQIALLAEDPSGTAQVAALQALGRDSVARAGTLTRAERAFRVDPLPARIELADALDLAEGPLRDTELPVAVGGDTLALRCLDVLEHGPGLLVAGPRRSGRSTTLVVMARAALEGGWKVVVVTARSSPLRGLAAGPASRGELLGSFTTESERQQVSEVFQSLRSGSERSLVVVDDLEVLGTDGWLVELIDEQVGAYRDSPSAVVAAGSLDELGGMYRGPVVTIKRSRSGLLLAPQAPNDGDLFGLRLPRAASSGGGAGRGVLVRAGGWESVQVPWPG
jgi:DNA segregation ATPase FtsK/SpoIIIE, S-DNA-T family